MTISTFANTVDLDDEGERLGRGARRRYREQKRREAEARQDAFDVEVAQAAYDHNISEREARRVVNERRRFEHKRAVR